MKLYAKIIVLIFVISLLSSTYAYDCNQELGCLLKKKFYCYVSSADNRGNARQLESNINYKNIFVHRDHITFFTAKKPQDTMNEQEIQGLNKEMNESYMERSIPFRHLRLDCGMFKNRICHAKDLPDISSSNEFRHMKTQIANADDKCVAFTFYDSSYKKEVSEKIAVICVTDPGLVKELLSFKNFLSRTVAEYHLNQANTRFDSFAGIELLRGKFITYVKGKPKPVMASLRDKAILLTSDDSQQLFVKNILLLGARNTGAYSVKKATEFKKLKEGWADKLTQPPIADCCMVLPGDIENDFLCVPDPANKKKIDSVKERCAPKLHSLLVATWGSLRNIQYAERLSTLTTDARKRKNCHAGEYKTFKKMIVDAGLAAVKIDCRILMQYQPDLFLTKKDYCLKHYVDEMEMMVRLISLGNKGFWNSLKKCTYKSFGINFRDSYTLGLMRKEGIETNGPSSFLQVKSEYSNASDSALDTDSNFDSESLVNSQIDAELNSENEDNSTVRKAEEAVEEVEQDELDEDDGVVAEPEVKKSKKKLVFTQLSSKSTTAKKPIPKVKQDIATLYSKPKKKFNSKQMELIKQTRESQMYNLQKTHNWRPSKRERNNVKFNKLRAAHGNKSADLFVTFLGHVRDTTYSNSDIFFDKLKRKYVKLKLR